MDEILPEILSLYVQYGNHDIKIFKERFRELQKKGVLKADARYPSVRNLVQQTGLTRYKVETISRLLARANLIYTSTHGTYVGKGRPRRLPVVPLSPTIPYNIAGIECSTPSFVICGSTQPCLPASWRFKKIKHRTKAMVRYTTLRKNAPDPQTELGQNLKKIIRLREISVQPKQIGVFAALAFPLIASCLLKPGQGIIMATPKDMAPAQAFVKAGATVFYTRKEGSGFNADRIRSVCKREKKEGKPVKGLFIRSSSDFNTGMPLSEHERKQVLKLAAEFDLFIIELDEDFEFSFDVPQKPLVAHSEGHRVIYVSCLSKAYPSDYNFKMVIAHPDLIKLLKEQEELLGMGRDVIDDLATTDYILSEQFQHYLEQLRRCYITARRKLRRAFDLNNLEKYAELSLPPQGFSACIHFKQPISSALLLPLLAERKIGVSRLSVVAEDYQAAFIRLDYGCPGPEVWSGLFSGLYSLF